MAEEIKTPKSKKQRGSIMVMIISGIIGGIMSAGAIIGYQNYTAVPVNTSQVITVDLNHIVKYKRDKLIEKYKGNYTPENAKMAESEVKVFMEKLEEGIVKFGKDRLILTKESVVGKSVDITDKLFAYANEGSETAAAPQDMESKMGKLFENEKK